MNAGPGTYRANRTYHAGPGTYPYPVGLITSTDLDRIRECAGERCAWPCLDRSKNGSRRWCDMTVCGNCAKARRHRVLRKRR